MKVDEALAVLNKKGGAVKCVQNGQTFKKEGEYITSSTKHKMAESAFLALYSVKKFEEVK